MKKHDQIIALKDINTFQSTEDNETYLCGIDHNGEPLTILFNTIELLEWLEISQMKADAKKYIDSRCEEYLLPPHVMVMEGSSGMIEVINANLARKPGTEDSK